LTVELDLSGVAHGGDAVGRAGDLVTFVSLALPGERVRAALVERKPRFQRARTVHVLHPSPARVTPPCPIFGTCGGCHWQHATYAEQLNLKTAVLRDQLVRTAGLPTPPIEDPIPSPLEWHYRNRAQLVPLPGAREVGFRRALTHDVVPVEHCYISDEAINHVIAAAPWSDIPERSWSRVEQIDLRVAPGQPPLVRVIGPGHTVALASLRYALAGLQFDVPGDAFFQVNLGVAELLVQAAREWLAPQPTDHVVDAYGGVGTFALALASHAQHVTLIESAGSALDAVNANAALNRIPNIRTVAATVEHALAAMPAPLDLVLVDPPRKGCGPAVVSQIVRLAPRRLVYVSCEPSTLARDARQLVAAGYRLARTRVVDMFPQTYHLESLSLFER
jgi:23S rRNA (uracil1939-C5)-methyltransferase